jgi:hypothetical protein
MGRPRRRAASRPPRTPTSASSRRRAEAAAHRRRRAQPAQLSGESGRTYLELASISEATLNDYRLRLRDFVSWCIRQGLTWNSPASLDEVLVTWLNVLYFQGLAAADGSKMVAAIKFAMPEFSRRGDASLPRSLRAVKCWTKKAPARQRLPLPRCLACLIAALLAQRGAPAMGLCIMLSFTCYLRPKEAMSLRVNQLVPPTSAAGPGYHYWGLLLHPVEALAPGKVGLYDEAVLIDAERWMYPFLEILARRPPDGPLWAFTGRQLADSFRSAWTALRLEPLSPSLYGLRHGGASEDLLHRLRTPEAVKRRGRWASDESLRRYGKETRLLSELAKLPADVLSKARAANACIAELLLGTKTLELP